MKHVIYYFSKGGTGKSSLTQYSASELQRLGFKVQVENIDQQSHVPEQQVDDADFCLYDTPGNYSGQAEELLDAAKGVDVQIIVPISLSSKDWREFHFLLNQLGSRDLLDNSCFVFNKVDIRNPDLQDRKETLKSLKLNYAKKIIPHMVAIEREQETSRTRNVISAMLHEVIL